MIRPHIEQVALSVVGRSRSSAGWMLAVAPQFDLVARLFAVVATVFSVRAVGWHGAHAYRVGAFRFDISHWHLQGPLYTGNLSARPKSDHGSDRASVGLGSGLHRTWPAGQRRRPDA